MSFKNMRTYMPENVTLDIGGCRLLPVNYTGKYSRGGDVLAPGKNMLVVAPKCLKYTCVKI